MSKCVICGYYGQGNAGDEALLISLLEMLPNHTTPIVLSGNPEETQKIYGIKSHGRLSFLSTLSRLSKNDYFIWGGGSLMQDATSIRSPVFYSGLMAIAKLKRLTTIAYGQGIGPLQSTTTRWLAKKVFANFDGITVRDKNSASLLDDWHIDYTLASDPVWALSSESFDDLSYFESPLVAVNLRSHSDLTKERLDILIKALILFQEKTETTILLIPFQKSKDLPIAKEISQQLKGQNKIIEINNPKKLKGLFKQVKMLIGMRLHSLIMAASQSCCCFALSYDPKVTSLMAELNLSGYQLNEIPKNVDSITNNWLKTYNNRESLSVTKIDNLKKKALLNKQLLEKFIKT